MQYVRRTRCRSEVLCATVLYPNCHLNLTLLTHTAEADTVSATITRCSGTPNPCKSEGGALLGLNVSYLNPGPFRSLACGLLLAVSLISCRRAAPPTAAPAVQPTYDSTTGRLTRLAADSNGNGVPD